MAIYIVTCFIPGASFNKGFLSSLRSAADHYDAKLKFIPTKHNFKSDAEIYRDVLDEHGINYEDLMKSDLYPNSKLRISAFPHNINTLDPTSGLDCIVDKKGSLIIGSPRHRTKLIPRSVEQQKNKNPRGIFCTGTVSDPYYKETKGGLRSENFHQYGALIISTKKNGNFVIRQLQPDDEGCFYIDMLKFSPEEKPIKIKSVPALSLGDLHPGFEDPKCEKATYKIVKMFKPKVIALHDWLDCYTISHHIEHKYLTKAMMPNHSLANEVEYASNKVKDICDLAPKATVLMVPSNHPEHFHRYLDECRYKDDRTNKIFALEHALKMAKGMDPAERAMRVFNKLVKCRFLRRGDSFMVEGIELNLHGDEGNNGARGNPKGISMVHDGESITGHTHTAEISFNGGFVNGTMTTLGLSYTADSGGSSWSHTHTVIYPGGARTHLFITEGDWEI